MSTLMQRIMAARLGQPLTAPASIPAPAQPLEPGRVELAPVSMAERRARIAAGHARRNAPSNAEFEAKREQWRAEALRKAREPSPPRPTPVSSSVPKPVEAPPPPVPASHVGSLTSRGSCKAINPDTGRQCALLAGHTKPHRHGSTEFTRVAAPGQQHFGRRDALDALAVARTPTTPGEVE